MIAIRRKGSDVLAYVGESHPALSGSEWERVEVEKPKPAPAPRSRTRKVDTEDE